METIWAFCKTIPDKLYYYTDTILKWVSKYFYSLWDWFADLDYFALWVIFGSLAVIGLTILLIYLRVTSDEFEDYMSSMEDSGFRMVSTVFNIVYYPFMIIWIVALVSAEGTNVFSSFYATDMTASLDLNNFKEWSEIMKIPTVYIVFKIILTVLRSVLTLRIGSLIRFASITLSLLILGGWGGLALTGLNHIAETNFLMMVITMPIFFVIYLFPMLIFWIPIIYAVALPFCIILAPIFMLFGESFGGSSMSSHSDEPVHGKREWMVKTTYREDNGAINTVLNFFTEYF